MASVSGKELCRQFRVLKQMLSIHAILRDRYSWRALFIDIILLACSVIFCATTFARDDVFTYLGFSPRDVRYVLGIASIFAFFASLVALRSDWKGKSARHKDAGQKLGKVLSLFREYRKEDGSWPQDRMADLHRAYWEAMNNIVEVPDRLFVALKSRHLRKVELSKMSDLNPGCPVLVLRLVLFFRTITRSFREKAEIVEEATDVPQAKNTK